VEATNVDFDFNSKFTSGLFIRRTKGYGSSLKVCTVLL
jgi:hypothetical protein